MRKTDSLGNKKLVNNDHQQFGSKMNKEIISMTIKSSKKEKDDIISVESRIMTRTTRYLINEKNIYRQKNQSM